MRKQARRIVLPALCAALLPAAVRGADAPNIEVTGAEPALRANILSHLQVGGEPCEASMARLQRLRGQVRADVQEAARALGYYQSRFDVAFSREQGEAGCWRLDIDIRPGEPVRLDDIAVDIQGGEEVRELFRETIEESGLGSGQQLNQGTYESLKNALSARAVENGFFSARFETSQIRLDLVANRADIVIDFNPGERFTFGQINIDSREALADEFIRRMIPFESGEPYASESLVRLREDLDRSRYFQQISISPQLAQASGRMVPLNIGLTMRPRHSYATGIGYTTDTGPRLRADYENRYLNRFGHQFSADAALSPVRSQANASYRLPLSNPVRESLDFSGGYIREDTTTFDSNRIVLEAAWRNESERGWTRNLFVNHQQDDYVVGSVEQDDRMLTMLGANLSRTRADDLIYPTFGWRLFTEIRGAADTVLSDVDFMQVYASAKAVVSVGGRGRFLARFEAGSTWVDDVEELPVSVRFFAGGDRSIRGYRYQALGPVNENGEVAGGRHLLVGSVEYDHRVRENWRVAAFFDSGNAFSNPGDWERRDSVGFGVRWLSPIGPIRADIAHAFEGEDAVRLHITMGPDL